MPTVLGRLTSAACLMLLASGCASYRFGNRTLYPQEIQTVAVPMFESVSFRRYLGERLTEAVVKEIEAKSSYRVAPADRADTVLTGKIVEETKRVLINARTGDPREYQVGLRVVVSWTDRRGQMLRETAAIALPPDLIDVGGTGDIVPEVGQSVAVAQQQAIERIAAQIVGIMEAPW